MTIASIRKAQQAQGPATIMAIATANPPDCFDQSTFADLYFRITNSEDKVELKEKLKQACEQSAIKKRYLNFSEEFIKENPNIATYDSPSLDARQCIIEVEVPKLGKLAATECIKEWGRPVSEITHLVFCSSAGIDMPGADYELTKLLGLRPSVKRLMLYHTGCYAGGTALRIAKDIAENNKDARVLVVSCELFLSYFRGPSDTDVENLIAHSVFGDGAAALIVGADPIPGEKPLFEIASADQSIVPDSDGTFYVRLRELGFMVEHVKDISKLICKNIENFLTEAFEPLGISDWNSIFWISHPGPRGLYDQIEKTLGLNPAKLQAARHVLSEYGNMGSATVIFTLNEVRKKSIKDGLKTTDEGLEWGVLLAYGPGLTAEIVVLHSLPT